MYFSLRQPIELGHQTRYRYAIAKSALTQQRWTVVQAELLTLVQTYRFFQTAAYRREKLRVARDLAAFNDRLVETLRRRLEASQVTADVVTLAEVESEATRPARQGRETGLRPGPHRPPEPDRHPRCGDGRAVRRIRAPELHPTGGRPALIEMALRNRPEIHAARAQLEGARAAIGLAKGGPHPDARRRPDLRAGRAGDAVLRVRLHHARPGPEQRHAARQAARGRVSPGVRRPGTAPEADRCPGLRGPCELE